MVVVNGNAHRKTHVAWQHIDMIVLFTVEAMLCGYYEYSNFIANAKIDTWLIFLLVIYTL